MLISTFAAVGGGLELDGPSSSSEERLKAEDRMRWMRDVAERKLVRLSLNLEVVRGASGDATSTGIVFGVAGVAIVELKADIWLCRVADRDQSAERIRAELLD